MSTVPTARETDRRLDAEIPALRRHRLVDLGLTAAYALAVGAQAVTLAWALAGIVTGTAPLSVPTAVAGLAVAVIARAGLSWARGTLARRSAATVVATLRTRLLARIVHERPAERSRRRTGELGTTLTTGLDALEPYYTGYRPARTAAVVVPPLVIAALAVADPISAAVVAVTLPLIPIFGALVGAHTRERTGRQWRLLARLGGHFQDATTGLPTLRAFGRAEHQVGVVRRIADEHRTATMRVLRVAFLSALVLELVATLSVALVAVPTGLRLLEGGIGLATALTVLFLAPEAYLPLRALGTAFHDSAGGVAVATRVFAVLDEEPVTAPPVRRLPRAGGAPALTVDRLTVRYPDRDEPALDGFSAHVGAGERVALLGPSGAGKSTLIAAMLGLVTVHSGRVLADGVPLDELDMEAWRGRVAWVPQRAHLFTASVGDNIRLGRPDADAAQVRAAARAAHADEFVTALPHGYDTVLGERGAGLSAGQRRRIALARAFLRDAPLLLLDEPTAHLDPHSEEAVVDAAGRLMEGRTTVVVAHRPALLRCVDRVIRVGSVDLGSPTGRAPADVVPSGRLATAASAS